MDLKPIYKKIWTKILESKKITLVTHIRPDGDTIGSAIALKRLIEINSEGIEVKISGDKYPRFLDFLPKNDIVTDDFFNKSQVIVIDTSTKKRIFDKRVITEESIKIDHHHRENNWLLEVGGDHWPATGQVIYEMTEALNIKRDKIVDLGIFVAIWTDTEGLTQRNITNKTHEAINALNIDKKETIKKMQPTNEEQELINSSIVETHGIVSYSYSDTNIPDSIYRQYVNNIFEKSNTEVILVIVKRDKNYRASLRSKGNVDISRYASKFGGGGHFSSAGFDIPKNCDIKKVVNKLIKEINE